MSPAVDRATPRTLGLVHLISLGLNGTIGVGIFFAPSQVAAAAPGWWGPFAYLLVCAALLPVAAIYATLGSRFPLNGGPYVWAESAFGPGVGFQIGWLTYVSSVFSASAIVSGFSLHAGAALGWSSSGQTRALSVALTVGLTSIVLMGLKPSARVWTGFALVKLVPLAALVAIFASAETKSMTHWAAPLAPGSLARAALIVVFATQGFEVVPVLAEDSRSSSRSVPLATVVCLLGASSLYFVIQWACVAALPNLAESQEPLVDAARALGGSSGAWLLRFGTNASALGIAFGMFAVTPHYLAVLGRDRGFLWLAKSGRKHVPRRAALITAAGIVLLASAGELGELFVLSSVAVMSQYVVSGLALLKLAARRERGLSPLSAWPVPLALGSLALLMSAARSRELVVALLVAFVGAGLYLARRRRVG